MRKNSFAICGGAYGDEGKGRIVDEYVNKYSKKGPVVVYRDNGGANAGHTVEFTDGKRIALHQLPSGIFSTKAVVILGKGMVLHPGDLIEEISQVTKAVGKKEQAKIFIDEMAVLSLDTHRAFEAALKDWQEGSKGSTGRGIAPAYADVLLRHPLRMRDLYPFLESLFSKHYKLYEALLKGLGANLKNTKVPALGKDALVGVGSSKEFIERLKKQSRLLRPHISDVSKFLKKAWSNQKYSFVFEKAQAIGLDNRWGVYPDITASDTTFAGISSSTEGIVSYQEIETRATVIKATYMSSVGSRILPTSIDGSLADKIREDANEYGATTKRPRGIAYLDLPALKFFAQVGDANCLVLTHMDIVYPKTPIRVCVGYKLKGKRVDFRPDQKYLLKVKPIYVDLETWDKKALQEARSYSEIPGSAKKFLRFISKQLSSPILMITFGPRRDQGMCFDEKRC